MGFLTKALGLDQHSPLNRYSAGRPTGDYGGTIDTSQQAARAASIQASRTGDEQTRLAQMLQAQALGQGPSLAQLQLQQATQANAAAGAGAIASQRGLNPALAARLISQQQAAGNQQAAGQAAQLRMQEQLGAQNQLAQALSAQRQGDVSQLAANSGLLGQAGGLENQASLGASNINAGVSQQNTAVQQADAQANADRGSKMAGGLLGGVASVLTAGAAHGALVGGKASRPGDNSENDTVPAMLSPGEIVIPRSIAQSENAGEQAKSFVEAIRKRGSQAGYGEVLSKHRELDAHMEKIRHLFLGGDPATAGETSLVEPPGRNIEIPSTPTLPQSADFSDQPEMVTPPPVAPPKPQTIPEVSTKTFDSGGEKLGELGLKHEADVKGRESKAQSDVLAQQQETERNTISKFDALMAPINKERDEHEKWIMDPKNRVDPNRLYHNQSTGQKIGSAIAVILGGLGSGLTHGPNMALEIMDKAIQRDVEAQKDDLGRRESRLSRLMQQGHSLQEAKQIAMAQGREDAMLSLKRAGLQFGGEAAQAEAERLTGALRQHADAQKQDAVLKTLTAAEIKQKLQLNNMAMQQQKDAGTGQQAMSRLVETLNGEGTELTPAMRAAVTADPKMGDRLVELPNGKSVLASSPENAKKITESTSAIGTISAKLADYNQMLKTGNPATFDRGAAKGLYNSILTEMGHLHDLARLTDTELHAFKQQLPDITDLFKPQAGAKLARLAQDIDAKVQSVNQAHLGRRRPAQPTGNLITE